MENELQCTHLLQLNSSQREYYFINTPNSLVPHPCIWYVWKQMPRIILSISQLFQENLGIFIILDNSRAIDTMQPCRPWRPFNQQQKKGHSLGKSKMS